MIIVITLYNLSRQSPGLSHHGCFHFSTHIASFIDKNWEKFFPNETRRKRKNLYGTIAGTLSQHSATFVSGTEVVGSIGWWKLSHKWTPKEFEKFQQNRVKRNFIEVDDGDGEEVAVDGKKAKLMDSEDLKLENCCLDTEDDLLKELNQLEEEISETCKVKTETSMDRLKLEIPAKIELTNQEEEKEKIFQRLKNIIDSEENHKTEIPTWIRRFYRKFCVRKAQQVQLKAKPKSEHHPTLLDRYCSTFHQQQSLLAGPASHDLFHSPYSNRILHPFIYRDKKTFPRWLKLMCELKHAVNGSAPERSTIDFCYAKPQHIAAVNSLLQRTFWPGIDVSESLSHPDFTIVALYKKLVIGCAFLVPDVCHNEAYISFLAVRPGWDRCGIASFMLYHLTQTSHGKDVTLHVSASNPAICLYQKFGFKTEELALDFYEKYLPPESPHSPHALFLRLTR